jgi:hypothetical protein
METFRTASRAQAQHIEVKLASAQCRQIAAETASSVEFSPDEIERLAALEHWRWCVDRWLDGWTYAPERNDARLQHNLLVPYDQLPEDIKEFDRHAVRDIGPLIELSGAAIQRELPIDADESDDADGIAQKAKDAKSNGMLPIVIVRLRTAEDLQLARDLQSRGIAVRLVAMAPIAVLAVSMPVEQLAAALDAADDVVCGTAPSPAASGPIEAVPSADTAFA